MPFIGTIFGFLGSWWKVLLPVVGVIAAYIVIQIILSNAYDRGFRAAQVVCEQARVKAEEAVKAKAAELQEQGRQAGILEGKRLAQSDVQTKAATQVVIRRIAGPIQRVVVHDCPLNMDAVNEVVTVINDRRHQINGVTP